MTPLQELEYRASIAAMKRNAELQRDAELLAGAPRGTLLRRTAPASITHCRYCGKRTRRQLACRAHADLPALDPNLAR